MFSFKFVYMQRTKANSDFISMVYISMSVADHTHAGLTENCELD